MIKTVEPKTIDYGNHTYGEYKANVCIRKDWEKGDIKLEILDQIFEAKGIRKLANDLLQVADILNKENNIG